MYQVLGMVAKYVNVQSFSLVTLQYIPIGNCFHFGRGIKKVFENQFTPSHAEGNVMKILFLPRKLERMRTWGRIGKASFEKLDLSKSA